jgi:hypothetical protein
MRGGEHYESLKGPMEQALKEVAAKVMGEAKTARLTKLEPAYTYGLNRDDVNVVFKDATNEGIVAGAILAIGQKLFGEDKVTLSRRDSGGAITLHFSDTLMLAHTLNHMLGQEEKIDLSAYPSPTRQGRAI